MCFNAWGENKMKRSFRESNVIQKNNPCTEHRTTIAPLFHSNHSGILGSMIFRYCLLQTGCKVSLSPENVYASIGELQGQNHAVHGDFRCLITRLDSTGKEICQRIINPPRKRHENTSNTRLSYCYRFFWGPFLRFNASLLCVHPLSSLPFLYLVYSVEVVYTPRSMSWGLSQSLIVYFFCLLTVYLPFLPSIFQRWVLES